MPRLVLLFPFAFAFLLGLAAAVYALARGIEHGANEREEVKVDEFGRELGGASVTLSLPLVATFLAIFGFAGYSSVRFANTGVGAGLIIGLAAGAFASLLTAGVLTKWTAYARAHDQPDERFVLQGHPATVVRPATDGHAAQIEYSANGRRVIASARAVGEGTLTAGAEVVIERLEGGIAYVETWLQVEERI